VNCVYEPIAEAMGFGIQWIIEGYVMIEKSNLLVGDYMKRKLGIYSWFGVNLHIKERLFLIKESGFDSTMLWWGDQVAFWELNKEELMKEANKLGLEVENFHLPYNHAHFLWEDNEESKEVVKSTIEGINDCKRFGVEGVVIHVENDRLMHLNEKAGIDNLKRVIETADKNGVIVAIENTKQNHIVEKVLESIDNPWLKLCYDASHDWLSGGSQGNIIDRFGHRLEYLHLSDNDLIEDRHWIPGDGKISWSKLMNALHEVSYHGNISFEVCPFDQEVHANTLLSRVYEFGQKCRVYLDELEGNHG